MPFSRRFITLFLLVMMVFSVIFFCSPLPQDPRDPSNSSISVVIKGQNGKAVPLSYSDTINRKIFIGAAMRLPENFDSINIVIKLKEDTVFDTTLLTGSFSISYYDTIWIEKTFFIPGQYTATFTPYTSLGLAPVTANITMIEAALIPENHKPLVSVSGAKILKPGDTCRLAVTATDADVNQTLTLGTISKPEGSLLKDNTFTWMIPASFTGLDTILFVATDNGYPQRSDTETVVITVTSTPHVPQITVSGDSIITPPAVCTLSISTSDEDAGQTLLVSMSGNPAGSVISGDSKFIWTATPADTGKHVIIFKVTDNGVPPLSSSLSFNLYVKSKDSVVPHVNSAPKWSMDTLSHIMNTSAVYQLKLSELCKDTENDPITYKLSAGSPDSDTIIGDSYSFTASAAATGTHFVNITAEDPSGAKNLLVIKLTVENSNVDTTGPEIAFVKPENGIAKTSDTSYQIDILCSDASGIASVSAAFGDKQYVASVAGGHYTCTINGLLPDSANTITITAIDSSVKANITSKNAVITYKPLHSVTYDANTGTGAVPADTGKYETDAVVTVSSSGTLVKTGFTFTGWNTAADGKGTARPAGSTFNMTSANITLYAQWKVIQYTVTYDGNGNTDGSVPVDAGRYDSATDVTVMANTGSLVKTGCIFDGWNTAADGKGTTYAAGTGSFSITANVTLFAKWKIRTYTLKYNGNGNSIGDVPDDAVYDSNTTVTVSGNINGLAKGGFDFNGWNTKADGSGVIIASESSFKIKSDTTLYAQWIVKKYKLTIETPVKGTISISGIVSVDSAVAKTIAATPSSGYKFKCWRVTDGSAEISDTASSNATVTLTQGNATIKAVFVCLTFVKQLQMAQYSGLSVMDIIQTDDGGYMLTGTINSASGVDKNGIVIKLDLNGDTVWTRTIPGLYLSAIQKAANGCIITGTGFLNDNYINVLCYGQNGNQLWSYEYFKSGYSYKGSTAKITSDNGLIIGGISPSNYDFFLAKTDAARHDVWSFEYDAGGIDNLSDCLQTPDGGYMMAGGANMGVNSCIIKVNSQGTLEWKNYFESALGTGGLSSANSISSANDGDAILGGYVYDGSSNVGYLMKVSQTEDVKLFKKLTNASTIKSIQATNDGYLVAGTTDILGNGNQDFYIAKVNSEGTIVKETAYGTGESEYCSGMKLTSDGGCIMTGAENWIIKTNENGEMN